MTAYPKGKLGTLQVLMETFPHVQITTISQLLTTWYKYLYEIVNDLMRMAYKKKVYNMIGNLIMQSWKL